ncbi:hypothetical protein OFY17_02700 [Marinomonas sp. C2222]|uniref:Uncharacterized protein n=1 Tax=Marinomonas sargassi TaxID=2984494 RepID=A0ABT2YPG1_9GAMM|nr:hypothetical protein [Marinomonas sargassi]MCV2401785.1 hypothetical protein [Marinomonas sargassi]
MPFTIHQHYLNNAASTALFERLHLKTLAQWVQHYQAETVDLRYFFHSGWSS